MTAVSKREALDALNKARTKAQHASERMARLNEGTNGQLSMNGMSGNPEFDAATNHYRRCVSELEQAINDFAPYETSGDDD